MTTPLHHLPSRKKRNSLSKRSGLEFPVRRIKRKLKNFTVRYRLALGGSIFLTAVMEYLVTELLDSCGLVVKQLKRKRIIPSHIKLAIFLDEELHAFLKGVIIPFSGMPQQTLASSSHRRSEN